ncbi:hypothetical protein A2U01_0105692, partial [Trifolium medium]|nr:hypothetical protein [Trifolium medium]
MDLEFANGGGRSESFSSCSLAKLIAWFK